MSFIFIFFIRFLCFFFPLSLWRAVFLFHSKFWCCVLTNCAFPVDTCSVNNHFENPNIKILPFKYFCLCGVEFFVLFLALFSLNYLWKTKRTTILTAMFINTLNISVTVLFSYLILCEFVKWTFLIQNYRSVKISFIFCTRNPNQTVCFLATKCKIIPIPGKYCQFLLTC